MLSGTSGSRGWSRRIPLRESQNPSDGILRFWVGESWWWFSYCIGREFGSVCRDVRSDTQVDGEWLLMGSGQRPTFLYICYIQLPLSPLSNHEISLVAQQNRQGFTDNMLQHAHAKSAKQGEFITGNMFVAQTPDLHIVTAYWNIKIVYMKDFFL